MSDKKYIVGLYDDEETLMAAVPKVRSEGLKIFECFTPFPVHGLDEVMGLPESRLHSFGFGVGLCGAIAALAFMGWINVVDYPLNVGGKPFFPLPSYVPIVFEATVLTSSVSMVIAFLWRCGLYPGAANKIYDERTTDDHFAMVFEVNRKGSDEAIQKIQNTLQQTGVVEITTKDFDKED